MVERQSTRFVTQLDAIIPVVPDQTYWHHYVAFYTNSEKMTLNLILHILDIISVHLFLQNYNFRLLLLLIA
jgi:hypothetical protein